MTALPPFLLVRMQTLLCLCAIERPHEPDDLGIAMQREELVEVGYRELSQHQPFRLDQHSWRVWLGQ
jgi:hypothetical protein